MKKFHKKDFFMYIEQTQIDYKDLDYVEEFSPYHRMKQRREINKLIEIVTIEMNPIIEFITKVIIKIERMLK